MEHRLFLEKSGGWWRKDVFSEWEASVRRVLSVFWRCWLVDKKRIWPTKHCDTYLIGALLDQEEEEDQEKPVDLVHLENGR